MYPARRVARPLLTTASVVIMAALALTACASSKKKTSAPPSVAGTSTSAVAGAASSAASGSGTSISAKTGQLGTYLTDASGRTLYVFAADTSSQSTCYGSCAAFWPPLTSSGTPQATSEAQAGLLGTTKRTDGATQVTYAGHPLYYFKMDTAAGDTKGQGKNVSGGLWWVVAPAGTPITSAGSSSASSSAPGGYAPTGKY